MSAAIIGGGIGGLTAALLLSRIGVRTVVHERSSRLGGRLAFEEGPDGYRIDRGPTIVLLPDMLKELLAEGGLELPPDALVPCDPLYRIHYGDGTVFHKYADRAKQLAEIESVFPGESDGFIRYMAKLERWFELGRPAVLERTFLRKRELLRPETVGALAQMKLLKGIRAFAAEFFRDARLQQAFSLQALYIGGSPLRSPALYSLIPYSEHAHGIWYLRGGYASLVPLIERELRRRGVEIRLESRVDSIEIAESRATGIMADGRFESADHVVFNGDFPGIEALTSKIGPPSARQRRYQPSSGCLLIYLGLERSYPDVPMHQFYLPESLDAQMDRIFRAQALPDDPAYYVFHPSLADPELAPKGHSVLYLLVPVPPNSASIDWTEQAPLLAERVLEDAERRSFPGLRSAIKWKQLRTPADAEADGNYMGGSFGIAPILSQSAAFRPQVRPFRSIQNLYAVGASVHPGGGVPIVMQGARLLVETMKEEMQAWKATATP